MKEYISRKSQLNLQLLIRSKAWWKINYMGMGAQQWDDV